MKNEKLNLTPKRNKNLTELKKKYDLNENSFKKMPTRYSVIPNFIFPPKKKKRDFKNDDLEILNHSKNIDGIINNGEELFNIPFEITEKEENLMKYCVSKRRNLRKKKKIFLLLIIFQHLKIIEILLLIKMKDLLILMNF